MREKTTFIGFKVDGYNPIIRPKTLEYLRKILKEKQPQAILEIGTYIGCSTAIMLEDCPSSHVVTVDKDANLCHCAELNLKELGFFGRYEIVNDDAFNVIDGLHKQNKKFDLIFLDGPKGQYLKYLPLLKDMLNIGGVLFADDVLFHGYVGQNGLVKHKHRTIATNLRKFLKLIQEDKDFITNIYDFEDGFSISEKIK